MVESFLSSCLRCENHLVFLLKLVEVSDIFLHFASASSLGTWLEEQFQQLLLASRIFSTLELEEHVQVLKVTYDF
uniref:Putative ovule protein n=1 Tax=Solanum chacoense TaxID=4108 RepID=A0A0V0H4H4_SOLCH